MYSPSFIFRCFPDYLVHTWSFLASIFRHSSNGENLAAVSGLADVVEISLCSICQPSLPARYALGVGARFGEWPANRWHTIPPLRLRPHQQFWLSSSALSHKPIHQVLSCAAPWRSLPAFAVGNVVRGTDATDICPITGQHLLPLQSPARTAIDPPYG